MTGDVLLQSICAQNLAVYRASPIRLREDVGQEAEIAHDYRGRLVYELLQNADDAMAGSPTQNDSIWLRLTDTDLWVGNSGRPLDDDDVRGLCGIGASSKGGAVDRRRASIGHKGMGFKSVLEITGAPEVVSETYVFQLGRHLAIDPVTALMAELGEPQPSRVPAMRFPESLANPPPEWDSARAGGVRTLFRFPLRPELGDAQRAALADRLLALPVTAILFLKHLERIEVDVETDARSDSFAWTVERERRQGSTWSPASGLSDKGIYLITVTANDETPRRFVVAHDNQLEIGASRAGLDEYAWAGVDLSEVSVAAELVDGSPGAVPRESRVIHVFLPTGEPCPYPLLINGAFSADLLRQEVRVTTDPDDYNRWLLTRASRVFCEALVPALYALGASELEVVGLLDRGTSSPGESAATATGETLVEAMREALSASPMISLPAGERVPLTLCVVPPRPHRSSRRSSVTGSWRRPMPTTLSTTSPATRATRGSRTLSTGRRWRRSAPRRSIAVRLSPFGNGSKGTGSSHRPVLATSRTRNQGRALFSRLRVALSSRRLALPPGRGHRCSAGSC